MLLTTTNYLATCDECKGRVQINQTDKGSATIGSVVVHDRREFIAALREQGWQIGPHNAALCPSCQGLFE